MGYKTTQLPSSKRSKNSFNSLI